MTITYPISLPLNPAPSSFNIDGPSFTAISRSPWSGSQQVQQNQGQFWTFSVQYPPMSDDQARNWFGILAGLKGSFGTFLFGDPLWKKPRGNWGSAPLVNGAGQTGATLAVDGLPSSAVIRAGDYLQLGSGSSSRLHVVTQDVTAVAGAATLDIWPSLRSSPADNSAIVVNSPKSVFRLAKPNLAKSWEPFRHGFALEMIEDL